MPGWVDCFSDKKLNFVQVLGLSRKAYTEKSVVHAALFEQPNHVSHILFLACCPRPFHA